MDSPIESWDKFLASYQTKSADEKEKARAHLSPKQQSYLKKLLDPAGTCRPIRYKDFEPRQTSPGGILSFPKYERLDQVLDRLQWWVLENEVEVVNLETVVPPNAQFHEEEGSQHGSLQTSGEQSSTWDQLIRLWYRASL